MPNDIRDILLNGLIDEVESVEDVKKTTTADKPSSLDDHIKIAEILEALAEEDTTPLELIKAAHLILTYQGLQQGGLKNA